ATAVELECRIAIDGRSDATHGAVGLRIAHVFERVHRGHTEVALWALGEIELAAQLLADQGQHRVVLGTGQVAYAHHGRVDTATGRTAHHQGKLAASAPGDQLYLAAEAVAGVEHQIEPVVEQRFDVGRHQEDRHGHHLHDRIDRAAAFGHRLDLGTAELPRVRRQLPVAVGHADVVGVDQRQVPHSAAHECFDHPRPHASHADHGHAAAGQAREGTGAI